MSEIKKCPYCAEDIKKEAIKCRYCGELLDLDTDQTNQFPWLFNGAYAIYSGKAKVPNLGEIELFLRMEVVELKLERNQFKIATYSDIYKSIFGKKIKLQNGSSKVEHWYIIGEMVVSSTSGPLQKVAEYESVVQVENLGARKCVIQEYSGNTNQIIFWDKELRWPLQGIVIFLLKSEKSSNAFKEVGRAIEGLMMAGKSKQDIQNQELMWSIDDLKDEFKKSRSPSLKKSVVDYKITETNIPGLPTKVL